MTNLSDILGGGGQTTYDVVIDAAGNGDYTSIRDALVAEGVNTTFYVRNGAYSETLSIVLKLGQKLIGESVDGVVLTSSINFGDVFIFPQTFGNIRGKTHRTSTNLDWDPTAEVGLITMTTGSAIGTYSGATAPIVGDACIIGSGWDKFDIVGVGAGTVTLDRPWRGTNGALDWDVWQSPNDALWKTQTHEIRNITIKGTSATHNVFYLNRSLGCVVDNVKITSANSSATFGLLHVASDSGCSVFNNIDAVSSGGGTFLDVSNFCSFTRSQVTNCRSAGFNSSRLEGKTTDPIKHNEFHWLSISSGSNFWSSIAFCCFNKFRIDRLSGATNFDLNGSASNVNHFASRFHYGVIDPGVFRIRMTGAQCIVSIERGQMSQNVEIKNIETTSKADPEFFNILTDSFLTCPINIASGEAYSNLIVSSSVVYSGIVGGGELALDSGYNTTSPPTPAVGGGQTTYDAIVDAAGGGDYTSVKTAVETEAIGATIFVINGAYSETAMTMKLGQKLVGQSREGVVITTSSGASITTPKFTNSDVACTNRPVGNTSWDTTSNAGTLDVTFNTNTAVYNSATDPISLNDTCIIGPTGEMFDIVAIDTGTNTVTFDRLWTGQTATLDWTVMGAYTDADWKTHRTEIKNLTIVNNLSAQRHISIVNAVNIHIDSVTMLTDGTNTSSVAALDMTSVWNSTFTDIEIRVENSGAANAGIRGIKFNAGSGRGVGNCRFENIQLFGTEENSFGGGNDRPSKYNHIHISKAMGTDIRWTNGWNYSVNNTILLDWIGGCTASVTGFIANRAALWGCRVICKHIDASCGAGGVEFRAAASIGSISYFGTGNVSFCYDNTLEAFQNSYGNVLSDSYINGTLVIVDASTIVTSSVMYNAISGAVLGTNRGFLF